MKHISEIKHAFEQFLLAKTEHLPHASEIAYLLKNVHKDNPEDFRGMLGRIPQDVRGEVLLELPEKLKEDAIEHYSSDELAEAVEGLDSDDAAELIEDIVDFDEDKSEAVYEQLDEEDREDIDKIRSYEDDQAGAWMQTELFEATLDETVRDAIARLKRLKEEGELENVHQLYIVNDEHRLVATVALEDMILMDFEQTFRAQMGPKEFRSVEATDDIDEVATIFEQYDVAVLPVVDHDSRLVGRITSDDIFDVIEERATEQIYNLAGVNDEVEQEEGIKGVFKNRASWLFVNLLTAILASAVIGLFDATIAAYVPLAILMPIVASMGGNAGTQTLTVMVRQMALGDIEFGNAKSALYKEIAVALLNGLLFALIMGLIAWAWFQLPLLGMVIGMAMIINLFIAGFFGASIPLLLKRLNIDPAVGSTVLLTTATDVFGFFSFLGLAKIILL
ncbi:magnesium transporter [Sulfurimonas sp. HSL-3221]|uniref:magnesium transporter n=1 Tax=Sulfurimonadaceae TaxID=2771471 RepID=UPI001E2D15D1|nr:magnesium transporter [Sulfurimonas sp. HSL-3221]UFS63133.1 magnesium transporter [Sulfurimonas sp. HSL-3221]